MRKKTKINFQKLKFYAAYKYLNESFSWYFILFAKNNKDIN
jgi:hypothetical protein